jgi:hypothetical protein
MLGGWVSLTVVVKSQLATTPTLAAPSFTASTEPEAEQVIVVVPTGKNEPDAGVHVTVPQLPAVVGAE